MKNRLEEASPVAKAMYEREALRVVQTYGIYQHLKAGEIEMPNIYVGKILQRAETTALVNLLIHEGVFTASEFLKEAAESIKSIVDATEQELKVRITTDGVAPAEAEGEQHGG
jgi:hypothetical protein